MTWRSCVVLLALLAVAGCGGSGESAESTSPTSASASTESTTTTSTTEPTTTTSTTEATTSTTSAEDAVREVHTRFMTELYRLDAREEGYEGMLALARELTVDPQLTRLEEFVASLEAQGQLGVGPGYDSNVVSVQFREDGTEAVVTDCSQGRLEGWSEDGELLVPADDFWKIRRTHLVLRNGQWFIENYFTGGEERCDPGDYR